MQTIRKFLNQRKSCEEILKDIKEYVSLDTGLFYWFNKLVKLSDTELEKLNRSYGKQVTRTMIENVDAYVYKTGKVYKSHYLTIIKWCHNAWIKKIPEVYICSFWTTHIKWEECTCWNF